MTPVTGAYGHAMANNYNGVPRPPVVFCADGDARVVVRRETYEDLQCPRRSGSACSATAPSARRFADAARASAPTRSCPITGLRPELAGVLTRSRGDFEEILAGSDLIVELIGGVEPARDYVLRAMRAGKHVVTANKQLLSQHGEELWACAREHGVQLRFEAAVAGVVPVIRVLQESLAAAHVERIHGIVNGTTNYILTEMARGGRPTRTRSRQAQQLGYAEADPTDDVTGRDAAAKMAILARLAFDTPVHLDQVRYEGIEHITADDIAYAQRARPRAQADRHRRARRRRAVASACTRRSSTAGTRSPPSTARSTRSRSSPTRSPRSRCRARARAARRRRSAVLGDVDQRDDPARLDAGDERRRCEIVDDVESRLLPAPGGRRPARRARPGRRAARHAGRLDQVGRAAGPGRQRAARDGRAPAARVALLRRRAT